jgi:two-component system, OmpR family, response regulator BaeR
VSDQPRRHSLRENFDTAETVAGGPDRERNTRRTLPKSSGSPAVRVEDSSPHGNDRAATQFPSIVALRSRLDDALLDHLTNVGYVVLVQPASRHLVASVHDELPSIVLLNLPYATAKAMAVCRELKSFADVPVIRISSHAAHDSDCVFWLEQGADDYLRRPVSPREVDARIKSILRRARPGLSQPEAVGLTIDCGRYVAALDGVPLPLTPAEFRVLAALDHAHERVVPRAELMRAVSCNRVRSERAVDSLIRNLRRKLQAVSPTRTLVHATYGAGYHLSH